MVVISVYFSSSFKEIHIFRRRPKPPLLPPPPAMSRNCPKVSFLQERFSKEGLSKKSLKKAFSGHRATGMQSGDRKKRPGLALLWCYSQRLIFVVKSEEKKSCWKLKILLKVGCQKNLHCVESFHCACLKLTVLEKRGRNQRWKTPAVICKNPEEEI